MHTTAEDMSRFVVSILNEGQAEGSTLPEPETVALMQDPTTSFSRNGRRSRDLVSLGHGLGLYQFRSGWFGYGGSAPGFQALLRYNPNLQVG
jgi:CubicO group peptidase (beta-lactamase class C family)